jgi:conjugative relaxase-like TrwC/TraI family protein
VDYLFFKGLEDAERRGVWIGRACPYAGVRAGDAVEPADLLLMLEGYSPEDRVRLQHHRKAYPARIAGWDFTFSVSKTLSLAASIPEDPISAAVRVAFQQSLITLFMVIEHMLAPNTGQPQPGDDEWTPAAGALFTHFTSRHNDPHLHAHMILPNACVVQLEDGTRAWRAVDPIRPFLGSQDLDRILQREMARRLAEQGIPVVTDADERVHLAAIPDELCRRYSRSHEAILRAEAEERNNPSGKPLARKLAKGRSLINTRIRPPKTEGAQSTLTKQDREELRAALMSLRKRSKKRVRAVLPYSGRRLQAEVQSALHQANIDAEQGRAVIARSVRAIAGRNRNTPVGALLDAVLILIRLASARRRERNAVLGLDDPEVSELSTSLAARARTFAYAIHQTEPAYAHTRETNGRHR